MPPRDHARIRKSNRPAPTGGSNVVQGNKPDQPARL